MASVILECVGKAYKQYNRRWKRIVEWSIPGAGAMHTLHWVLRDISLTAEAGEAIGIVGGNGAGKSTLLKMIAGTTQPTTGTIHVQGTVAALLELGMGFHGEFSARQNVIMSGQLLGLTKDEINTLLPEVESFADIGDYFEQPLRIYSSGMRMRLAFAVATMKRPSILIVDEALAVGDAFFKEKCINRIMDFRDHGTTLLIVSHGSGDIQKICNRAVLLHHGCIVASAKPKEVIAMYKDLHQ